MSAPRPTPANRHMPNRNREDQRGVSRAPAHTTAPDESLADLADQLQSLAIQLRNTHKGAHALPLGNDPLGDRYVEPAPREHAEAITPSDPSINNDPDASAKRRERYLAFARARYDARRKRNSAFEGIELFGEPAWDILLDLYIAYAGGKRVSVSSACIGSAAPPTTGLRWLGVLQAAGLVEREHDPRDQRRVLVHLSDRGVEKMETYFDDALRLEL